MLKSTCLFTTLLVFLASTQSESLAMDCKMALVLDKDSLIKTPCNCGNRLCAVDSFCRYVNPDTECSDVYCEIAGCEHVDFRIGAFCECEQEVGTSKYCILDAKSCVKDHSHYGVCKDVKKQPLVTYPECQKTQQSEKGVPTETKCQCGSIICSENTICTSSSTEENHDTALDLCRLPLCEQVGYKDGVACICNTESATSSECQEGERCVRETHSTHDICEKEPVTPDCLVTVVVGKDWLIKTPCFCRNMVCSVDNFCTYEDPTNPTEGSEIHCELPLCEHLDYRAGAICMCRLEGGESLFCGIVKTCVKVNSQYDVCK